MAPTVTIQLRSSGNAQNTATVTGYLTKKNRREVEISRLHGSEEKWVFPIDRVHCIHYHHSKGTL